MSPHTGLPAGDTFEEKLEALRQRIDLLPEAQRSHLFELADTIQQQHFGKKEKIHELTHHANR